MKQSKLIVFFTTMSVIVLAMFNFTMFSQLQIYTLEQYQMAYVDYVNADYVIDNDVFNFAHSQIQYATSLSADIDNGIIIDDNKGYHVVNQKSSLIPLEGDLSIDNIYTKYLVYYYSFYLSPVMFIAYISLAFFKCLVGVAIIYMMYRFILHKIKRDDTYVRELKFIDYRFSIATTLLLGNLVYAYSSFFIGYKLPLIIYATIIISSYVVVLKTIKKLKR